MRLGDNIGVLSFLQAKEYGIQMTPILGKLQELKFEEKKVRIK
jgi:hypothetical protein